jgi:hypothetical protein
MVDQQKPQITFYSHWLPALGPGKYSVCVTPTLKADLRGEKNVPLERTESCETFEVGAPRFALTGSEVYSCYPTAGAVGEFSGTLPHVVFDRCTLPWERTIDGSVPTVPHNPWLALILLSDSDFGKWPVKPVATGTVEERLVPEALKSANVVGPAPLSISAYEKSDLCQTIDLPEDLFQLVMPRPDDLPYLAHVRAVQTNNKETWSLLKEGKFSVVICNRFPETEVKGSAKTDWGKVNTVYLISLEGWGPSLKQLGQLKAGKSYRLVVLGSWRFTCQGSSDFKTRITALNDGCLLGQRNESVDGGQDIAAYISSALHRGFTPVNHGLRNGDTTVSWYRGPLIPTYYRLPTSYDDLSSADKALRYDPATGMLDTSFAAAWQLGRLLALQDQAFAQALHRFRSEYERWLRRANDKAILGSLPETEDAKEKKIRSDNLKTLRGNLGVADSMREWYIEQLKAASLLSGDETTLSETSDRAPEFPITVQNWLGQAMLLYGVPFQYIVPDEKMLPRESIRFFFLNPDWIECLLQGACSLGRSNKNDGLADQLLRARFFELSQQQALQLRSDAKLAADRRRSGPEGARPGTDVHGEEPANGSNKPELHWPLSGYLLRSAVVESWIGLESRASGVGSTDKILDPLQILRMDRLAPDVLLCIYNGKVTNIEIKQPPEAVHFGAGERAGESTNKNVDNRTKSGLRAIGTATLKGSSVDVPMRTQRVVDIARLATLIKEQVGKDKLTSAEFAFEMIDSPAQVTFKVDGDQRR